MLTIWIPRSDKMPANYHLPEESFDSCPVCESGLAPQRQQNGRDWLKCHNCGFSANANLIQAN
jgi:hypothetical protein